MDVNLFGDPFETSYKKKSTEFDKKKRKWENKFQKWSDKVFNDGNHYGACGFGAICDYCGDNSYGRPCVRALNEMLRKKRKAIDYDKVTFEDAFDGKL